MTEVISLIPESCRVFLLSDIHTLGWGHFSRRLGRNLYDFSHTLFHKAGIEYMGDLLTHTRAEIQEKTGCTTHRLDRLEEYFDHMTVTDCTGSPYLPLRLGLVIPWWTKTRPRRWLMPPTPRPA